MIRKIVLVHLQLMMHLRYTNMRFNDYQFYEPKLEYMHPKREYVDKGDTIKINKLEKQYNLAKLRNDKITMRNLSEQITILKDRISFDSRYY
jgi:hypothetical protein